MTYSWVEHTSEVELAICAATPQEVFTDACEALRELIATDLCGPQSTRTLSVEAADRATLLSAFIDELVYLAEVDGFVCERLEGLALGLKALRVAAVGRIGRPRQLVKAVTYHRLRFERRCGRFMANVVLDV